MGATAHTCQLFDLLTIVKLEDVTLQAPLPDRKNKAAVQGMSDLDMIGDGPLAPFISGTDPR